MSKPQDARITPAAAVDQYVYIDDGKGFAQRQNGILHVVPRAQQIGLRGSRGQEGNRSVGLGIDGALEGLRERQQAGDAGRVVNGAIEYVVARPSLVDAQRIPMSGVKNVLMRFAPRP